MRLTNRLKASNRPLEYFVVFAVVVLISIVSFVFLSSILAETRDSRRTSDIGTLRAALEFYHIDHGAYPHIGWANSSTASWDTLGSALKPYLAEIPRDPINDETGYVERTGAFNYSYYSAENKSSVGEKDDYTLVFRLERPERAPRHAEADSGLVTARGPVTFLELTGADCIYAVSAP